jgi:hypothetical protein
MNFMNAEHKQFYIEKQPKDVYERAFFYLIGLCPDTRRNAHALYDADGIKPEAIHAGWQTSASARLTRLAFNLYTDNVPTAHQYDGEGQIKPFCEDDFKECRLYSISDIFCCEYAPYFMEAIKLRYPEYCRENSGRPTTSNKAVVR